MVICVVVVALIGIFSGIPFAFSILIGVTVATMAFEPSQLSDIPAQAVGNVNDPLLIAIPVLIIAGEMLSAVEAISPVVNVVHFVLGRIRGSLGLACVGASMFFAGSTGSSAAESAAVASAFRRPMAVHGYPPRYVAALVAASTAVGVLFPPSLAMILYSDVLQYPVTKLWVAGLMPGIMTGVLIAGMSLYLGRRALQSRANPASVTLPASRVGAAARVSAGSRARVASRVATAPAVATPNPAAVPPQSVAAARRSGVPRVPAGPVRRVLSVVFSLAIPVFVVGGIYSGILTLSEVATALVVVVVLYGFLLSRVGGRVLWAAIRRGGERAGAVFITIIAARLFANILVRQQTIQALVTHVGQMHLGKFWLLLAINVALILAGVLMDGLSLIIIAAPILSDLVTPYGISPTQLAVIMAMNIEIAVVHPPFGGNLYAVSAATGVKIGHIAWSVLPYVAILLVMLAIVTYVPLPGFNWVH